MTAPAPDAEAPDPGGLVAGYRLDGRGGGEPIGWTGVRAWRDGQPPIWVHLDRTRHGAIRWLREESGLDPIVAGALAQEDTRPRVTTFDHGLVVILRGVNLNPGADPEDMIALRCWVEPTRIITLRSMKIMAIQDLRDRLESGAGPTSVADLLADLCAGLLDRLGPVVVSLSEEEDHLEERLATDPPGPARTRISQIRREAIALRRFAAPQREALFSLHMRPPPWFSEDDGLSIRESADRIQRYAEDLEALRDRCAAAHEELSARINEQMNRAMYLLTTVAALFLPLGLLTGLLGINVAGIPGTEAEAAFWIVCGVLAVLVGVELWILRRFRML